MTELSSKLQRLLALGILLLLTAGGFQLILGPSIGWMNANLSALDNSRFQINRLEKLKNRPALPTGNKLADGTLIKANNHKAAKQAAIHHFQSIAKKHNLTAVSLIPLGEQALPSLVVVEMDIMGPEANMIEFITELENSVPLAKFSEWRLSARDGQEQANHLHLTAKVRSVWAAR